MRQLNIGICGLGTVGSGVLSVLQNNSDIIREKKSSCLIHVTHVATRNANHGCNVENIQFSKDIFEVARDSDIDLCSRTDRWNEFSIRISHVSNIKWKTCSDCEQSTNCRAWYEYFASCL